jgi:hypothetical protein
LRGGAGEQVVARSFFPPLVFQDAVWVIDGSPRLGDVWKLQ